MLHTFSTNLFKLRKFDKHDSHSDSIFKTEGVQAAIRIVAATGHEGKKVVTTDPQRRMQQRSADDNVVSLAVRNHLKADGFDSAM